MRRYVRVVLLFEENRTNVWKVIVLVCDDGDAQYQNVSPNILSHS